MALHGSPDAAEKLLWDILYDYAGADLLAFDPAGYGFETDVLGRLETLDVPTLVLTGALETGARKRHAEELVARAPRAHEVVLPNCGHLSNLTSADAYNNEVRRFCSESALPASP